jgi:hypothetical protein
MKYHTIIQVFAQNINTKILFGVKRQQFGSRRGLRKEKNFEKISLKEKESNVTENSVHTFFP